MDPIIIALTSALFGALSGFGVRYLLEQFSFYQSTQALAAMLAAELAEEMKITEIRGYEKLFKEYLDKLKSGSDVEIKQVLSDPETYNHILRENISKIGVFGLKTSTYIVEYFVLIRSVRKDMNLLALNGEKYSSSQKILIIDNGLKMWDKTTVSCNKAINALKEYSETSTWRLVFTRNINK